LQASEDDSDLWVSEQQWSRGPNSVESTPSKQMEKAKHLETIGDVRQAADAYKRLADVYRESDQSEEALVYAAKNYLAAGNYTSSREMLKELRRRFVHPTYLDAMGQVETALARGFLEGKGEGGTYTLASRLRKARSIYNHILDEDSEGRWADRALLGLGQCYEAEANWDEAIKKYKQILEQYPNSDLRTEAEGRIGYCLRSREPIPNKDMSQEKDIQDRLAHALRSGDPTVDAVAVKANLDTLNERQSQRRYEMAQFYIKNGHKRGAEIYLESIRENNPSSPWAKKAEEQLKWLKSQ
jgi:tetratricopeptide (TPR) repeat protein